MFRVASSSKTGTEENQLSIVIFRPDPWYGAVILFNTADTAQTEGQASAWVLIPSTHYVPNGNYSRILVDISLQSILRAKHFPSDVHLWTNLGIYLNFKAENPYVFAERVSKAVQDRYEAQNAIKYQLYVDCMPTAEGPHIDNKVLNRINFKTTQKKDKSDWIVIFNDLLLQEVKLLYIRTFCEMTFRKVLMKNPGHFPSVTPPKQTEAPCGVMMNVQEEPRIPNVTTTGHHYLTSSAFVGGGVQKRRHRKVCKLCYKNVSEAKGRKVARNLTQEDFQEVLKHQRWVTVYSIHNSVRAMQMVVVTCLDIQRSSFYNTAYSKNISLEEFERVQTLQTNNVGKGWFNIYERNWQIYDISKLSRFMLLIKFRMQFNFTISTGSSYFEDLKIGFNCFMTSSPAAAPSKRLCGAASFKQSSMSVQPTRWRANLGFYLDPNNSHCDGTKACRLYGYLEKRSLLDLMSLNDFAKRVVVVCRENEDCVTRYDKWCKSNALRTQRISRHVHHICRGSTPLHILVINRGDVSVTKRLLSEGANLLAADNPFMGHCTPGMLSALLHKPSGIDTPYYDNSLVTLIQIFCFLYPDGCEKISKAIDTRPVMYRITDTQGEEIEGSYHEEEFDDLYDLLDFALV
ncbi:Dynein heavy chain 1, axonemal [Homalodisca vitripennis]|nr:Dynein heavy chain 1, axonemal [Homalodisca vitripennis]